MSISNFLVHSYHKNNFYNSLNSLSNFSQGGIFLDDNLYGKCVLPESKIKVNNKDITIKQFFLEQIPQGFPSLKVGQEKTYFLQHTNLIDTWDISVKKFIQAPIQSILCQMIAEPIKKIVLENEIVLECTVRHRLLKLVDEKNKIYYWENNLRENDIIAIKNKNILKHVKVKKIILEKYEGYVFDLVIPLTHNYVVNDILSHNTSVPIIHNSIPKYFKFTKSQKKNINLIICPSCRLSWWQEKTSTPSYLLNHKSHYLAEDKIKILKSSGGQIICSYHYLEANISQIINLDIAVLKIDLIPMELDAKKTNLFWSNLQKIKAHIGWTIINYRNSLSSQDEIGCKMMKLYGINSNSNSLVTNKIVFESKNSKKLKMKNIELTFGKREIEKYQDYVKKFEFIYEKNEILFQEDVFLQKYCSYPQSNLKINYFCLDTSAGGNIYAQSQILLRNLGSYSKNLISNFHLLHQYENQLYSTSNSNFLHLDNLACADDLSCNICLQTMRPNNLGITECGHVFCYSCLLKNMKYQKKCPRCRTNIDNENIYLYSQSSELTKLSHQHIIEECQDELNLGTKISSLLKLIMNLKKSKIVISNFDDNLKYIQDILTQFQIKSILVNHKNYSKMQEMKDERIVYLINYKFKFYKLPSQTHIRSIICNEPLYSQGNIEDNKNILIYKLHTLKGIYPKSTIYNLYIKNTIEDKQIQKIIS